MTGASVPRLAGAGDHREAARAAPLDGRPAPPAASPATAFYDSSGELVFTHQGVYEDQKQLAADIDRYAR